MNDVPENLRRDLGEIGRALSALACSVTLPSAESGTDAAGEPVECLTEAVMGVTAGLVQIARAIHDLADAVRQREP